MDGGQVRVLAGRVRNASDGVRDCAGRLRSAGAIDWSSTAAGAFGRRLAVEGDRVFGVVELLDAAVTALLRHAVALEAGRGLGR